MYNVYFKTTFKNDLIATCEYAEIWRNISNFIKIKNPEYKVYYVRAWEEDDGKLWYDVGSHTQFFYAEKIE